MRKILLWIAMCLPVAVFSQSAPVKWKAEAIKLEEGVYKLTVAASMEHGWKVYATTDTSLGMEAVRVSWENTTITGSTLIAAIIPLDEADPIFDNKVLPAYHERLQLEQQLTATATVPSSLLIKITAFASNGEEFLPLEETLMVTLPGGVASDAGKKLNIDLTSPAADCGEQMHTQGDSLFHIFGKGFMGGLIALLMPCIFPMLPVTVSFFMNRATSRRQGIRNGFLYGGFILAIYVLASVPFHLAGSVNPQLFNIIATDKWVNLVFFAVFLLFALSLFGLFDLKLPGATGVDKRSGTGSIVGIFFMALTLVIVSFSCTGPILGFLLVNSISETNGAWALTAGMAGFGVALALPFGIFAIFPQWLKKLPRSGGWMETLKKSLAFVELALALKFLSNADLVEHWGFLKREVFIAIWIIITLALAGYLLNIPWLFRYGKWNVSRMRSIFGIGVLLFALYLMPGLTRTSYANLSAVSGFPPPLSYSIYGKTNVHGKGVEPAVINDYEKALALSRQTNKPLLIDFTGWACVNCRKMEENVWTREDIKRVMEENFIVVSLYVDDRKKLAEGGTVGEKWASFQSENFASAAQPQYVILSPDEELLNHPVGYSPANEYSEWLQCGLSAFNKKKAVAATNAPLQNSFSHVNR